VDHQSRSGVGPKKKRRDPLIQRAMAQPTWALGFGDEVWWSRLAQPNQHGWTDAEATYKLQELSRPTDDPDPKALACYGLLRRPGPLQADQRWLRFVAGRLVICHLPSKSPWLNPIEPQWVHGKRAVSEPGRLLSATELEARVYAYYSCEREAHLVMPKKVA
jgi:hypothetical protein